MRLRTFLAFFRSFFVSSSESTYTRGSTRSASPSAERRFSTTGHFLQRGPDLQQRFLHVTVFAAMRAA